MSEMDQDRDIVNLEG